MKPNQKKMISALVKEGRLAKGYTQKELSELSNISIRSIQRIENGEILPRSYTIKTLANILGVSVENMQKAEVASKQAYKMNRGQKIILSAGAALFILLLSWAFMAQSPHFPETAFELLVYSAFILLLITAVLVLIWRTRY